MSSSGLSVGVCVGGTVILAVGIGVAVGLLVGITIGVGLGVAVGLGVGFTVGVGLGVAVGVGLGLAVIAGDVVAQVGVFVGTVVVSVATPVGISFAFVLYLFIPVTVKYTFIISPFLTGQTPRPSIDVFVLSTSVKQSSLTGPLYIFLILYL